MWYKQEQPNRVYSHPTTKHPTDRLGQASMIRTHLSSTFPIVPLPSVTPSAVSTSYTKSKRKWLLLYMHTLLKWCNMYFFFFYTTVLYTQDNHPHPQFLSHLHVLQTQQICVVFASIGSAQCWANLTKATAKILWSYTQFRNFFRQNQ